MELDVKSAVADIESTPDMLERAMKPSGLIDGRTARLGKRFGYGAIVGSVQVPFR